MDRLGIIIIGRNEGERLVRCLSSVGNAHPLVYVDSGSTDQSVANARSAGASVVELDMSIPFNAARARNEGFARLMEIAPATQYVQFIDGDCEMIEGWIERAATELDSKTELAAVCGRLRERFPDRSIYNRLCDLEWETQPGIVDACGGIAMYRVEYFRAVGGFDATVPAGEEPELCQRLRQKGWRILRLKDEMAWHDAGMTRFKQWWRRQFRTGYSGLDVARRFGLEGFAKCSRSARVWTLGPAMLLVFGISFGAWRFGWCGAATGFLFVPAILLLQAFRIGQRGAGMVYGMMTLLSKWGQLLGQIQYYLDRRRGHSERLIEYKQASRAPARLFRLRQRSRRIEVSMVDSNRDAQGQNRSDFQADAARYPRRPWLKEQSFWAIAVYRFGRWNDARRESLERRMLDRIYWLMYRIVETATGITLPKEARIGPGLRIHHFGGVIVHSKAILGANCTLRQGVTIGNRQDDGPVPVIGDNVEFGAYAQVLGGVRIGHGAKIGAMSVVLCDVPDGATAVGVPARIIQAKDGPGA